MEQNHPPTLPKKKGWTPLQIKAAIVLRGLNFTDVGRLTGYCRRAIEMTVKGEREALRCRRAIAGVLGVPVTTIWPDAEVIRKWKHRDAA